MTRIGSFCRVHPLKQASRSSSPSPSPATASRKSSASSKRNTTGEQRLCTSFDTSANDRGCCSIPLDKTNIFSGDALETRASGTPELAREKWLNACLRACACLKKRNCAFRMLGFCCLVLRPLGLQLLAYVKDTWLYLFNAKVKKKLFVLWGTIAQRCWDAYS